MATTLFRNPLCFVGGWAGVGNCDGVCQDHHLVKQQTIRRRWRTLNSEYRRRGGPKPWSLSRAIGDRRLQVLVCKRHHDMIESREIRLQPEHIAYWAQNAVDEYGLEAEGGLWRDYPPGP